MEDITKGFIQLPHSINNVLLVMSLTSRQRRTIELIVRLTLGCQKRWARLNQADLQTIGILPSHAKKTIESLLESQLIIQNGKTKEYRLNEEYLASEVTKKVSPKLERLSKLVGRQLEKSYHNSNEDVTESVITSLPNQEVDSYQNGNTEPLLKQEDLASEDKDFVTPKDILNKSKYSDINSIADKNLSSEEAQKMVNPKEYIPSNVQETAALEAWRTLEPFNPLAFTTSYLWAMNHGLPVSKFYEFTSEIKQDPSIKNPGAIFRTKVENYFRGTK